MRLSKTRKGHRAFRIAKGKAPGIPLQFLAIRSAGLRSGNAPSQKFSQAPASGRAISARSSPGAFGDRRGTGFAVHSSTIPPPCISGTTNPSYLAVLGRKSIRTFFYPPTLRTSGSRPCGLAAYPELSSRAIAKMCGVDHVFVGKIRAVVTVTTSKVTVSNKSGVAMLIEPDEARPC